MISAAEFKKHISKSFSARLKQMGFNGSGFNYSIQSEKFVFAIGIQPDRYGGGCYAEFGLQPKDLRYLDNEEIDSGKVRYYNCEFRTRLHPVRKSGSWKYGDNEEDNIQIANEIAGTVKDQVLPVVQLLISNPNYLETLSPTDLTYQNFAKKFLGVHLMMSDVRTAWVLTKVLSKSNPTKARAFAEYGLSKLPSSSPFIGRKDFENVLAENRNS